MLTVIRSIFAILLLLNFSAAFAQQSQQPSLKETVEFLNDLLASDAQYFVKNFGMKFSDSGFLIDKYGSQVDFSKAASVSLGRDVNGIGEIYWPVSVYCKTECMKYDGKWTKGIEFRAGVANISFTSQDSAERYAKALRHLISLKSGKRNIFN